MDARAKTVREILYSGNQYLIPFFQRFYSWKPQQWERLRSDLSALLESNDDSQHFMGPLVCTPTKHVPTQVPAYQLIDGQQRLTTLTVALAALRDVAKDRGEKELANKISRNFLLNEDEEDLQRYKVLPRLGDREALIAIINGASEIDFPESRVDEAWKWFRGVFSRWTLKDHKTILPKIFNALTNRLSLVVITIDGENPYEIFESLNSTGLPLEESDLIRNYLFMQVPLTGQDKFHKGHWQTFEGMFDKTAADPAVAATGFYRDYLMRNGAYSRAGSTFVEFKEQNRISELKPEEQVAELKRFAKYELMLQRPAGLAPEELSRALSAIQQLEVTTAHCLILNLLHRHDQGHVDTAILIGCLDDLASFVIRRSICGETTRGYARWFPEAIRAIKDDPRGDLRQYWLRRGWPDDATFQASLLEFAIYRRESLKCRLILESLEHAHKHKEPVALGTLTVEHVMPQSIGNDSRGKAWQEMLGENWRKVHEKWLHTLGNLTLSGYNSEMSNNTYIVKQPALADGNIRLNKYFKDVTPWDEASIKSRGIKLAVEVTKLWPRPAGEYVPGGTTEPKSNIGRERRLAFWTEFAALLKAKQVDIQPSDITGANTLYYPSPVNNVELWTFFNRKQREMQVGLSFRRKRGRMHFDHLQDDKEVIGEEFGQTLQWIPGTSPMIYAALPDASLKDRQDWLGQQEWIADRLKSSLDVLFPRLQQFESQLPAKPDTTDTQKRQVEYWAAFREFMLVKGSVLKVTKPLPQCWNTITIGLGTTKLYAIASSSDSETGSFENNEVRAELVLEGKKAKARFAKLSEIREVIDAEFDEPPVWYDQSQVSSKIFFRQSANLLDKAQWPSSFTWLKTKLELLQTVMVPRVQALKQLEVDTTK